MRSEFDFIDNLKSKYSLGRIGDDCSIIPKDSRTDQVITADLLIEGIDFRLDWTSPEFLGHKALAVSLSDIAAMGARPVWAMLSIGVPEAVWKTDFLDKFYNGWFALAKQFGVELIGGDTSRTPDQVVIDSIVIGEVAKGNAILRSGAKAGESIYVTGELGGAAGGLRLLEKNHRFKARNHEGINKLLLRQLQPHPQLRIANILNSHGLASSMIDLSDGLSSDVAHLCRASGVGAKLYAEKIPVNANLSAMSIDLGEPLEFAINGGEDFELLFTARAGKITHLQDPDFSCIGEITDKNGLIEFIQDNKTDILKPKGFRHF